MNTMPMYEGQRVKIRYAGAIPAGTPGVSGHAQSFWRIEPANPGEDADQSLPTFTNKRRAEEFARAKGWRLVR